MPRSAVTILLLLLFLLFLLFPAFNANANDDDEVTLRVLRNKLEAMKVKLRPYTDVLKSLRLLRTRFSCVSPWLLSGGICFFKFEFGTWSLCHESCAQAGGSLMWYANTQEHDIVNSFLKDKLGDDDMTYHLGLHSYSETQGLYYYGSPMLIAYYRGDAITGKGEHGKTFLANTENRTLWSSERTDTKAYCVCRRF